jgi:hypothetical protein
MDIEAPGGVASGTLATSGSSSTACELYELRSNGWKTGLGCRPGKQSNDELQRTSLAWNGCWPLILVFDSGQEPTVDEQTARSMAREVIRPTGLLGYLVGRGKWWSDESRLKRGRLAVGRVMGATYVFLGPVWKWHPSLDPGRVQDPLGLAGEGTSLQDTPEDLRALLRELEQAVGRAAQVLVKELPESRDRIHGTAREVVASIREAEQVLRGTPPS